MGTKPPARIPIKAAKDLAEKYNQRQVIVFTWDGATQHCVTYGVTPQDCDQAAQGGNKIKKILGWPDSTFGEPNRVKKLKQEITKLKELSCPGCASKVSDDHCSMCRGEGI